MSIYVAKTPDEFRAKAHEMGATAFVYLNGPFASRAAINKNTPENIQKIFNDCVFSVAAASEKPGGYIPLSFEAHKDGKSIIMGRWSILHITT